MLLPGRDVSRCPNTESRLSINDKSYVAVVAAAAAAAAAVVVVVVRP